MDSLQIFLLVIGAIMCIEGIFLLRMSADFWQKFRDYLLQFSVGQIHTIGMMIFILGAVVVLSAYFFL